MLEREPRRIESHEGRPLGHHDGCVGVAARRRRKVRRQAQHGVEGEGVLGGGVVVGREGSRAVRGVDAGGKRGRRGEGVRVVPVGCVVGDGVGVAAGNGVVGVAHALGAALVCGAAGGVAAFCAGRLTLWQGLGAVGTALGRDFGAVAGGGLDAFAESGFGQTPHEAFC